VDSPLEVTVSGISLIRFNSRLEPSSSFWLQSAFRKAGSTMARAEITQESLKQAMKEALSETLTEQRDLFRDVFTEVLEDFALVEAIEEGRRTEKVERSRILDILADGS